MEEGVKKRFGFAYESGSTASCLLVKTDASEKILNYQIEMVANNQIPHILPFSMRHRDGELSFCYEITSRLTLSQFLRRMKISRNDLIGMLIDISAAMTNCRFYLLNEKNMLFDADYIYINPASLDIWMVYVPVDIDADFNRQFKAFVTDVIVNLADIDRSDTDNFIQKILSSLKSDTFNVLDFKNVLHGMLKDVQNPPVCREEYVCIDDGGGDKRQPAALEKLAATNKRVLLLLTAGVMFQILIVVFLIYGSGLLKQLGGDSATTYVAIALIAAAVDVLIFKCLLKEKGEAAAREQAVPEDTGEASSKFEEALHGEPVFCGNMSGTHESGIKGSSDTVLLFQPKDTHPYLQGLNNGMNERISIVKPDFVIGRLSGQVDHVCWSNAVGKVHAQIISRDNSYFIKDINSRNGTFVNNMRIDSNKEYEIKCGDRIALANSDYEFVVP